MPIELNATHDPARRSWVESANAPDTDFPIQNLPFGVFDDGKGARGGVALGDSIIDLVGADRALVLISGPAARGGERRHAAAAVRATARGGFRACARRCRTSIARTAAATARPPQAALVPMAGAKLLMPAKPTAFTDFCTSADHILRMAANGGRAPQPGVGDAAGRLQRPRQFGRGQRHAGYPARRPVRSARAAANGRRAGAACSISSSSSAPGSAGRSTLSARPVDMARGGRAAVRLLPGQRLVGARHPVLRDAARPASRQELPDDHLAVGGDDGGARAVPRRRRAGRTAGPAGHSGLSRRRRSTARPGGLNIELTAEIDTGAGPATIVRTNVAELFWTLAQMVAHQASRRRAARSRAT